jgi:hypothetical protein
MKHIILVAGVDYEFKGVDFRVFCDSRVKRILARNTKKEDLTFQIFDFRRGEVATHEFTYPAGKRVEKAGRRAVPGRGGAGVVSSRRGGPKSGQ